MKKLLADLIGKRFSVYVEGEFERTSDFMGFVKLLADYTDFFQYSSNEKKAWFTSLIKAREVHIDSNIYVKLHN